MKMVKSPTIRRRTKRVSPSIVLLGRCCILLVMAVALALGYVHLKAEETRLSYEIWENQKVQESLTKETAVLEADYQRLLRPTRIASMAGKSGFKFPTLEDVIYIDQQKTVVGERNEP